MKYQLIHLFLGSAIPLLIDCDEDDLHFESFPLKPKFPRPLNGSIPSQDFLAAAQGAMMIYGKIEWNVIFNMLWSKCYF